MRAIGLVLLSIGIMALLLTDADAKRRSSAQRTQAAGANRSWCATYPGKGISDNCSYATQQMCLAQVWGLGGFCRPNPFPGTAYGTGYTWGGIDPGDVLARACQDAKLDVTAMAWLVPGQLIRQARVRLTPVRPVER